MSDFFTSLVLRVENAMVCARGMRYVVILCTASRQISVLFDVM